MAALVPSGGSRRLRRISKRLSSARLRGHGRGSSDRHHQVRSPLHPRRFARPFSAMTSRSESKARTSSVSGEVTRTRSRSRPCGPQPASSVSNRASRQPSTIHPNWETSTRRWPSMLTPAASSVPGSVWRGRSWRNSAHPRCTRRRTHRPTVARATSTLHLRWGIRKSGDVPPTGCLRRPRPRRALSDVGAWGEVDRDDPYWNETSFNGASLSFAELAEAPDPTVAALLFFRKGFVSLNPS